VEATEPEGEETRNRTAGKEMVDRKIKAKIFIVNVTRGYIIRYRMNKDQDEEVSQDDVISQKLRDAETLGYEVAFDPDEAERIAFHEDALSDQDARDSVTDL
jgi:hypothetical protein